MISLIMHPRDQARAPCHCGLAGPSWTGGQCSRGDVQISRVAKMLADEFGTASNIKNRVNRQARRRRDQRAYGLC